MLSTGDLPLAEEKLEIASQLWNDRSVSVEAVGAAAERAIRRFTCVALTAEVIDHHLAMR